ncbi:5184_t:CDS:1 [Dentiscutata erythropus]|uniref:5184_t:CDS:1 n=1 Tax=Dentiscutata erythropus TaxID=1348616 RepID=A0A9N9JTU7_9GLOM|nr:5184_t:CDS:1 [Dentiscutata erythropus]
MSTTDDLSATMPYKDSFSYKNDNINVLRIEKNVRAMIERINSNIARLYFVNNHDVQIPIPANIVLRDVTSNQDEVPYRNEYLISWVSDYILFRNGVAVFALENQKQQAIKGGADLETDLIQQ